LIFTDPVAPEVTEANATVDGQPAYYQAFFDLTRQELDPDFLALYPQGEDFAITLRGSVEQVMPFLVDEAGNSLTAEAFALDSKPGSVCQRDIAKHRALPPHFS
jgi:hypothetical protein